MLSEERGEAFISLFPRIGFSQGRFGEGEKRIVFLGRERVTCSFLCWRQIARASWGTRVKVPRAKTLGPLRPFPNIPFRVTKVFLCIPFFLPFLFVDKLEQGYRFLFLEPRWQDRLRATPEAQSFRDIEKERMAVRNSFIETADDGPAGLSRVFISQLSAPRCDHRLSLRGRRKLLVWRLNVGLTFVLANDER